MTAIDTPCVNICVLDRHRGICTGCGRTTQEIAAWATMSSDERRRVMSQLAERLRVAAAPAPLRS